MQKLKTALRLEVADTALGAAPLQTIATARDATAAGIERICDRDSGSAGARRTATTIATGRRGIRRRW